MADTSTAAADRAMQPVTDASAWTAADLARDRSWELRLAADQQAELVAALQRVNDRHLQLAQITREHFPLPHTAPVLASIAQQLSHGRGFVVLHGVPVDDLALEDLEKIYWGLCAHLGTGVTQNSDRSLIHYVTDGELRPEQGTRGVGNPGKVGLHVDLSDCVALFCVRQAPDDPPSVVASSMTVYNEILGEHPEWLPQLQEGFIWNRAGEEAPGETPVSGYRVPAFSVAEGVVSCRFNSNWISKGMERVGRKLTAEEQAIFEFIRDTAAANSFAFPLHPGDIALCNNYTVFHGRAGHEPVADEAHKRLLMRIWLDLPDRRPFADEGLIRYGVIRHGSLGWTAADLLAGNDGTPHRRRPDGVPAVG